MEQERELFDTRRELFNAQPHSGIALGTVIMMTRTGDAKIIYAGPIKGCPPPDGKLLLMNVQDFKKLQHIVNKRRH